MAGVEAQERSARIDNTGMTKLHQDNERAYGHNHYMMRYGHRAKNVLRKHQEPRQGNPALDYCLGTELQSLRDHKRYRVHHLITLQCRRTTR
eukprot:9136-Heterococcus_DN1.PRE.3